MEETKLKENIDMLNSIVAEAAGSRPVTIVAATKTRSPELIQAAHRCGISCAGENRVQEFCEKLPMGAYEGMTRHFIGHLQTNKVSKIVGSVELIQSVDSIHLLTAINRQAEKIGMCQDVLAEINIGGETAKSGMAPDELDAFLEFASSQPNIRIMGLMTVAPLTENDDVCQYFNKMYKLFIDKQYISNDNIKMKYLSMGMSGDFKQALACGSNMIRIGTGIFGPRF